MSYRKLEHINTMLRHETLMFWQAIPLTQQENLAIREKKPVRPDYALHQEHKVHGRIQSNQTA